MTKVGDTHDVVIHVNNSISVGLIAKPQTYRVVNPPQFIPRFAVGDPRGLDFTRWRSFVQDDFSGGAGQYIWSAQAGNDRYAESNLIQFGIQPRLGGNKLSVVRPASWVGPQQQFEFVHGGTPQQRLGDPSAFALAAIPVQTTAQSPIAISAQLPVFVEYMSNAPHLVHGRVVAAYHSLALGTPPVTPTGGGVQLPRAPWSAGQVANQEGVWIVRTSLGHGITHVLAFSNGLVLAGHSNGIRLFNSTNGIGPAYAYTPSYSTVASEVFAYDARLWRIYGHQIASLDPVNSAWSAYTNIGNATSSIVSTATFQGRQYFGKTDSVWAFEAGRAYEVYNFRSQEDQYNCLVFIAHRGALYFNIRQTLYRLTVAGTIEVVDIPPFKGSYFSAASQDENLYISIMTESGSFVILVFNSDTGATYQWFGGRDIATQAFANQNQVPHLAVQAGHLWLGPMHVTGQVAFDGAGGVNGIAVAKYNLLTSPERRTQPGYYRMGTRAFLITSEVDFGYPHIDKIFNRVVVDYTITTPEQQINVYYRTGIAYPKLQFFGFSPTGTSNYVGPLIDAKAPIVAPVTASQGLPIRPFVSSQQLSTVGASAASAIVMAFDRPPLGFQYYHTATWSRGNPIFGTPAIPKARWEYWTGTGWRPTYDVFDTGASPGREVLGENIIDYWYYAKSAAMYLGSTPGWIAGEPTGYATGFPSAYHLRHHYLSDTPADTPPFTEVVPFVNESLDDAATWSLLGTITDQNSDQAVFSLPVDMVARTVMLRFEMMGSQVARPSVTRYEVEWHPVGPNRDQINASLVVIATEPIELLDGTVENSGAYINATLWSLSGAGIPYVVQLPYPSPVAHTRRMLVRIAEPGAVPPVLAYGHSSAGIGAEIPIVLEEM